MKLFSRKSLVAAAASTALLAGVVAAPANAEAETETQTMSSSSSATSEPNEPSGDDDTLTPEPEESSSDSFLAGSSTDDGTLDPGQLRDWVAVFTAIIGALSTVFVFMERTN